MSPDLKLRRLANAYQLSRAVQVAARLGIGRLLRDGPMSCPDLARATATDGGVLIRLLRFLAELQVVEELPGNVFGPTPVSNVLHRVDNIGQGEEAWATWSALPEALESGRPVFSEVHGQSFYEYAQSHPQQGANWRESTEAFAAGLAPSLVDALDLSGAASVVDVGGGQGTLLAEILRRYPDCRGILLDLPEVVRGAPAVLKKAGISRRCEVSPGDALEGVPVGADVYLLSRVLFNWQDEQAVRLLSRCRGAVNPGGRVMVAEVLSPPEGTPERRALAGADLHHFLLWGSKFRTLAEYETLFGRAGLVLAEVREVGAGDWRILEGRIDLGSRR